MSDEMLEVRRMPVLDHSRACSVRANKLSFWQSDDCCSAFVDDNVGNEFLNPATGLGDFFFTIAQNYMAQRFFLMLAQSDLFCHFLNHEWERKIDRRKEESEKWKQRTIKVLCYFSNLPVMSTRLKLTGSMSRRTSLAFCGSALMAPRIAPTSPSRS